ncbi:MAG: FAD-dependent oxidoreductase [Comamonadaceae bacterium]
MRIAVVGAGIIGVTTAYELALDGHQVHVLERRSATAEEASFANAGLVAPGYLTPWDGPGMPGKAFGHLLNRYTRLNIGLPLSGHDLIWMWKFYRACKSETYLAHRSQLQRLAAFSMERLHHITSELKLNYERSAGCMVLLRSPRDVKMMKQGLQGLRDAGVTFQELNPADARKIEPALNPDLVFHGALHLPEDEVANCRQFALLLKNEAQRRHVEFAFNTTVTDVKSSNNTVSLGIAGENTPRSFDAAVICAGVDSVGLLKHLGLKVPLTAIHGYSISAAIREPINSPVSAIVDEHYQVTISRIGNRVRVAGGAELGGSTEMKRLGSLQALYKVLHDCFPGCANLSSGVQEWKGARPMLPSGKPIIGASGIAGVWFNLGHGSNGWALSCGSAKILSDLIGGKKPDLDAADFVASRLRA